MDKIFFPFPEENVENTHQPPAVDYWFWPGVQPGQK